MRIHLKDCLGNYLCFPSIKTNPKKLTTSIKECNCELCLKIVKENNYILPLTEYELNANQTSLTNFA